MTQKKAKSKLASFNDQKLVAPDHIKSLASFTKLTDDEDWWYGPSHHDIENYDIVQKTYREKVEEFIQLKAPTKTKIAKKIFYTISTNVLIALDRTSKDDVPDRERDLYQPLEICISRWSISKGVICSKHFLVNPGGIDKEKTDFGYAIAKEHSDSGHKIDLNVISDGHESFSDDYRKILSEIYQFIGEDKTVFSCSLKHVRQDIGSLKWLLKKIHKTDPHCYVKYPPIKVYSLWDLFVVLARQYCGMSKEIFGKAVAERILNFGICDELDPENMCEEHAMQFETQYCAKTQAEMKSKKVIKHLCSFEQDTNSSAQEEGQAISSQGPTQSNGKSQAQCHSTGGRTQRQDQQENIRIPSQHSRPSTLTIVKDQVKVSDSVAPSPTTSAAAKSELQWRQPKTQAKNGEIGNKNGLVPRKQETSLQNSWLDLKLENLSISKKDIPKQSNSLQEKDPATAK